MNHIAEIEIMLNESFEFLKLEYTYVFNFWPTDPFFFFPFFWKRNQNIKSCMVLGDILRMITDDFTYW